MKIIKINFKKVIAQLERNEGSLDFCQQFRDRRRNEK